MNFILRSWISGWLQGRSSRRAQRLELLQDQARGPLILQPKILFDKSSQYPCFQPTSERKLLTVGFTKSVLVTLTFDEKFMFRYVLTVFSSYRNSVRVWVVTQGKMQFDTRLPSKSSPMTPEKMKKTVKSGTYWSTTHLPVVEPVVDNFYQVGKLLTTLNDF